MPCRKLPCLPTPSWKAAEAARLQLTCTRPSTFRQRGLQRDQAYTAPAPSHAVLLAPAVASFTERRRLDLQGGTSRS